MARDKLPIGALVFLAIAAASPIAHARPSAPSLFCKVYPTAIQCRGSVVACTMCHTAAPALNAYGQAVGTALDRTQTFEVALPSALAKIENDDIDSDGKSNAQELAEGTWPGNAASVFESIPGEISEASPEFTLRRLSVAFCGESATYEQVQALNAASDKKVFLHAALDACLKSSYWRTEAISHIADPLIRPVGLLGHCGLAFLDFEPDYNLFEWAMTDGHNASEILTAQYFVDRSDKGVLSKVEKSPTVRVRAGISCSQILGAGVIPQNVDAPYRAGMLTTANFLLNNTQGTYLPRVSAGIAYRNWIGADIAQYQALYSVPDEPRDIDKKGLKNPVCASCHATLDPIAYAFAYYYGAGGPNGLGSYGRDRPEVYLGGLGATREIMDDWYNDQPVPHLFGKSLGQEYTMPADTSSLVKLVAAAAKSDLFARHITGLVFRHVVGNDPEPRDADEFVALWKGLQANEFSVDQLCHLLIDTKAFGSSQ